MVTLIICTYNRPAYLAQCFASLQKLTTWPDKLLIIDDASTEIKTLNIIKEIKDYFQQQIPVQVIIQPINKGIRESLYEGIGYAFYIEGASIVINLDSDMIVKPDFIYRMLDLKKRHPDKMISGINCTMRQKTGDERNPLISEQHDYYLKKYVAGQCLCYDQKLFDLNIRPALLINGNWDHNACISMDKVGLPVVVCKPSVAQHIGYESSMGHNSYGEMPDRAYDFDDKIKLPDVTLLGVNAHNPSGLLRAAEICQRHVDFGDVNIITERLFPGATLEEGRRNYSAFMIKQLYRHFNTSHVLVMNDDAYIQNPLAWDDRWLQYDYVGASWDWYNERQVGNGGFSLRSKRLCDVLATDDSISELHPCDDKICRKYRPYLEEKYGIKFAPVEVAKKFSIEGWGLKYEYQVYGGEFGFHGHLVRNMPIPYAASK